MDPAQYLITTLTNVFGKFLPWVGFAVVVYLVAIKLPFYFIVKVQKANKDSAAVPGANDNVVPIDLKKNQEKEKAHARVEQPKREQKKEHRREQKQEKKQEKKSEPIRTMKPQLSLAEEIFELTPGQLYTKAELKKKYHDLLKKNHPDKVDSLGSDFKKLAEKKTKDINQAYQKLRSRAS